MNFNFEDFNEPKIINQLNQLTDELNIFNECHTSELDNKYIKCILKNTEHDIYVEIVFDNDKDIYSIKSNIDISKIKFFKKYLINNQYDNVILN